MKKLFAILALSMLCTVANAQAKWPYGAASFITPTVTSKVTAQTITISNNMTYADLGVVDTNKVITVAIGTNSYGKSYTIDKGALLFVKVKSDGTARAVTTSAGCSCSSVSGVISKTKIISYVYDGTNFNCTGAIQID